MQFSAVKRSAFKECYDLQNVMLEFERSTYQNYLLNATDAVEKILQRNILILKIRGSKLEGGYNIGMVSNFNETLTVTVKTKKIVRLQSVADSELEAEMVMMRFFVSMCYER